MTAENIELAAHIQEQADMLMSLANALKTGKDERMNDFCEELNCTPVQFAAYDLEHIVEELQDLLNEIG